MSNEILVLPDSKELSEQRSQVLTIQKAANEYVIVGDVVLGEQMLRDIKAIETSLLARKEEITRPLMKSLASIRDLFRPFETGLADAKKTIKEKILAYQIESEEKARIAAEKVAKRVEKGTMRSDTAAGKLATIEDSKVKTNTRTVRKLSIVDETLIPREYLTVNREKITGALFAGVVVPGAELVEEKILVIK
jgi:hypothetical protein